MTVSAEMPRYRCHKEVWALQIASVALGDVMIFADSGYSPQVAGPKLFDRYTPVPGDYYVVYDDGYESISPKAAFEAGYTRL